MKNKLTQAILRTLIYSDIFDFPLRISEIHRYLIGFSCSEEELSKLLYTNNANATEYTRMGINQWQGYFYLGDKKEMVAQRIKKEKIAKDKLEKAKKLTAILKIIPWIKMVTVTGRVAALNCEEKDDIDLMIVTETNRLWLSRACEWFLLSLLGCRRKPYQTENLKDKLCPNLYISEENPEFPHQDLFTANELARVKVIWERNYTYQKLVETNEWAYKFLPNWWDFVSKETEDKGQRTDLENRRPKTEAKRKSASRFLFSRIRFSLSAFGLLECMACFLQLKYMQKHQTTEVVKEGLLMFHPRDMREKVLGEFNHRLQKTDL